MINKKRIIFFSIFLILSIGFFSTNVLSQDIGSIGSDLEDRVEGAEDKVEGIEESIENFTESDKQEFLATKWKKIFLENKIIGGIDKFFTKINPVFVFLFSKSWSLSMEMYFAFLLWIFTFLSLRQYMFFVRETWLKWIGALIGVLLLAHSQVLNYVVAGMIKVLYYKQSFWWLALIFFTWMIFMPIYFAVNRFFAKYLEKRRKKKEEEKGRLNQEKIEGIVKGLEEGEKAGS